MIVRSLQLKNFRSFVGATVVFGDQQNYVVGNNWQGKSSLVEGIVYALFGADAFPRRLAGAAVKAEHLVTDDADSGHVELTFSLGDHEYTVRRSLPRATVSLSRDGKTIASGKRPVDEKLHDLLAVDAKFFANVFYADQDELRKSFDLTPADRRLFVERLIGQEVWRDRIDGLRRAEKHLRAFIEDLTTGRFGAFIEELDRLTEETSEAANELEDLENQIAALRNAIPKKDRRGLRDDERKAEGEIAELEHGKTSLTGDRTMVDQTIRDLAKGKCPTCTQAVPPKLRRDRLADLRKRMRSIDANLRAVEKVLARLNSDLEDVDFEDLNDRLDELNALEERKSVLSREQDRRVEREKRLRGQARVFGKKPDQHQRAAEEVTFLGQLIEVINEHRAGLRGRIVKELVTAMNDLLARFHDGDFDAEAVIDAELDLNVKLHGREVPLTNLSGAAKDMFAIALRYGLMRVAARHVECLMLDEPTRHMDPINVRQLKAVFDDFDDRQLIVVTIQEEFSDARGRHFTVTKDGNHRSVVNSRASSSA
jgi:exonuclease SbcC